MDDTPPDGPKNAALMGVEGPIHKEDRSKHKTADTSTGQANLPFSKPADRGEESDEEYHRRKEREDWRRKNRLGSFGLVLTLLAAGGGLFSAYESSRAVIASQAGAAASREAADEAKMQTSYAKRQVDDADRQASTAEAALYSIQRAYLAPELPNFGPQIDSLQGEVTIPYTNKGVSTAKDVNIGIGELVIDNTSGELAVDESKLPQISLYKNGYTILPGLGMQITLDGSGLYPSKLELEKLRSGNAALYVFGRILYKDVFNKQHHTNFCSIYRYVAGTGAPKLNQSCSTWTDAD